MNAIQQLQDPRVFAPLLAFQRGGISEVVIHGSILIARGDSVEILKGGDFLCYGRSLLKPFQIKVFAKELSQDFSLESQAVSVASHNAERRHLDAAQKFLHGTIEISLDEMQIPAALPLVSAHAAHPHERLKWNHPCSAKHAAILRGCALRGWPRDGYLRTDHPYHEAYLNELRLVLGEGWVPLETAVDGCGLPAPSMTLAEMAKLMGALARCRDQDWIWKAMTERPEWVGGENRLDTKIMQAGRGRVLAKEGADGLLGLAIAHPEHPNGVGIVVKIAHGWNPVATSFIAAKILESFEIDFSPFPSPDRQTVLVYT